MALCVTAEELASLRPLAIPWKTACAAALPLTMVRCVRAVRAATLAPPALPALLAPTTPHAMAAAQQGGQGPACVHQVSGV